MMKTKIRKKNNGKISFAIDDHMLSSFVVIFNVVFHKTSIPKSVNVVLSGFSDNILLYFFVFSVDSQVKKTYPTNFLSLITSIFSNSLFKNKISLF